MQGRLNELDFVMIDELHLLGDSHRGYVLELLLTKLLYAQRKKIFSAAIQSADIVNNSDSKVPAWIMRQSMQIVGLTATLKNIEDVCKFLGAQSYSTQFRPVQLLEYAKIGKKIVDKHGKVVRVLPDNQFPMLDEDHLSILCAEVVNAEKAVLMFCPSQKNCENVARNLSQLLPRLIHNRPSIAIQQHRTVLLKALSCTPHGLDAFLATTVPQGVAFHHAGLTTQERSFIEAAFRSGTLNVLCATSTLGTGVNLPAHRVIFREQRVGIHPLTITQYQQMCGRAGRTGLNEIGESIIIVKSDRQGRPIPPQVELARRLMSGKTAKLASCLHQGPGGRGMTRLLLEPIANGLIQSKNEIADFVGMTLYQEQCMQCGSSGLELVRKCVFAALDFLKENTFVRWVPKRLEKNCDKTTCDGLFEATHLGLAASASGMSPEKALVVCKHLSQGRQQLVLSDPLHMLYLVTPLCGPEFEPNWLLFYHIFLTLSSEQRRIATLLGVEERVIFKNSNFPPRKGRNDPKLIKYHRFWLSLILWDLIHENSINSISSKFSITKGKLQSLQRHI